MSQGFPELTPPGGKPVVNSIFDFSDSALGQLRLWLEQNPPAVPITSVLGFSQFTAQANVVETEQSTTSTSFTDLTTTGPSLANLPAGSYVVMWGAIMVSSTTDGCLMGIQVGGTGASTSEVARVDGTNRVSATRFALKTLTAASTTITAKYRVASAGTATFGQRFLVALRYANA